MNELQWLICAIIRSQSEAFLQPSYHIWHRIRQSCPSLETEYSIVRHYPVGHSSFATYLISLCNFSEMESLIKWAYSLLLNCDDKWIAMTRFVCNTKLHFDFWILYHTLSSLNFTSGWICWKEWDLLCFSFWNLALFAY